MNTINHLVLSEILDLMAKSHTGKSGGGYGCMKKAAILAVDTFGERWISPARGKRGDKILLDFLKKGVMLTCPPDSNVDKFVAQFLKYAEQHAAKSVIKQSFNQFLATLD